MQPNTFHFDIHFLIIISYIISVNRFVLAEAIVYILYRLVLATAVATVGNE